jgi:hypothetical protein
LHAAVLLPLAFLATERTCGQEVGLYGGEARRRQAVSGRWAVGVIAIISIALWALAPLSWIQAVRNALDLPVLPDTSSAQAAPLPPPTSLKPAFAADGGVTPGSACAATATPTPLPAVAPLPTPTTLPVPIGAVAPPSPNAQPNAAETFRLCGGSDPATARAIEQFIAGRGFSARLVSRSDGCADLTITVSPGPVNPSSGRQSSHLSVSAGGGNGPPISIQIVSQNGVTHVVTGPGN